MSREQRANWSVNLDKHCNEYVTIKHVKIFWDEDCDLRVIPVAGALIARVKKFWAQQPIISLREHEGSLTIELKRVFLYQLQDKRHEFARWLQNEVESLSERLVNDPWALWICREGGDLSQDETPADMIDSLC